MGAGGSRPAERRVAGWGFRSGNVTNETPECELSSSFGAARQPTRASERFSPPDLPALRSSTGTAATPT
jgi:hypothetical protein